MQTKSPRKTTPLFLVFLMLLAPLAAANVTNFANGTGEAEIDIRDGNPLVNINDGAINLPDGETVTGATMTISTSMVEHAAQSRIDLENGAQEGKNVWDPADNNQLTEFSDISLFQIEVDNTPTPVSLKAEGFLTDFEGTGANFMDRTDPSTMPLSGVGWDHGSLSSSDTPAGCASGNDCWGTNLVDDNYTDDNGVAEFKVSLHSAELFVDPLLKSKTVTFDSWHNLETAAGTQTNTLRFLDCGNSIRNQLRSRSIRKSERQNPICLPRFAKRV